MSRYLKLYFISMIQVGLFILLFGFLLPFLVSAHDTLLVSAGIMVFILYLPVAVYLSKMFSRTLEEISDVLSNNQE